jgi:uncharacterized protein YbjT (DUF2867 family)
MKVLVVGATGMTGQHVVRKLLARGDVVTAFARSPSAVAAAERLHVAQGEARDADSLVRAVAGQDAVISTFGPRSLKRGDVQEVFMQNLIAAMKANGVRRLVNLSAAGAGDSRERVGFMVRLFFSTILRHLYADKERGEVHLFASGLDYVNARPGRLINKPARGNINVSMDPKGMSLLLTREDLADFMVEQLTSDTWLRKSPLLGY